ncbi:MAG: FMN-dependent NADH-azoreductase [Chlorobiaceae bacterium]|nr:FMN-dependent NADH-azoreductase [Chlorobiaceae bacterium]
MRKLLQIKTSIFSDEGQSSRLSNELVAALKVKYPDAEVVTHNFAVAPLPHLDATIFQALVTRPEDRSAGQQAVAGLSDALIEELKSSDVVVLGLPMYNLGIPSTLKAWFDQVTRAGITFSYTENGVKGLLPDRKVYVIATRGGRYAGTPYDTQTGFVQNFFNLIGIHDVEFIYAEGLNMGEDSLAAGLADAHSALARICS